VAGSSIRTLGGQDQHGRGRRWSATTRRLFSAIRRKVPIRTFNDWSDPPACPDGSLVVEAMTRAQSLFPWLLRGEDFDNDSAFINDVVVPWSRTLASLQEERSGVSLSRRTAPWFGGSSVSFKLKERRREGAKGIKRYHAQATPHARALAHPKL